MLVNDRHTVQRLLSRVNKTCGQFAPGLFLEGVTLEGNENSPVAQGGFADIYKGRYNGKDVAIKRLKCYTSRQDEVQKVWQSFDGSHFMTFTEYPEIERRSVYMGHSEALICTPISWFGQRQLSVTLPLHCDTVDAK